MMDMRYKMGWVCMAFLGMGSDGLFGFGYDDDGVYEQAEYIGDIN